MDTDDSIVIREFQRRFNDAVSSGIPAEEIDTLAIEDEVIRDACIVRASLRSEVSAALTATVG
jgi:hypothetical protein